MTSHPALDRALAVIDEHAWARCAIPVRSAILTPGSGSPMPRSLKSPNHLRILFPVWRYHPFVTNTDLPVDQADVIHR